MDVERDGIDIQALIEAQARGEQVDVPVEEEISEERLLDRRASKGGFTFSDASDSPAPGECAALTAHECKGLI